MKKLTTIITTTAMFLPLLASANSFDLLGDIEAYNNTGTGVIEASATGTTNSGVVMEEDKTMDSNGNNIVLKDGILETTVENLNFVMVGKVDKEISTIELFKSVDILGIEYDILEILDVRYTLGEGISMVDEIIVDDEETIPNGATVYLKLNNTSGNVGIGTQLKFGVGENLSLETYGSILEDGTNTIQIEGTFSTTETVKVVDTGEEKLPDTGIKQNAFMLFSLIFVFFLFAFLGNKKNIGRKRERKKGLHPLLVAMAVLMFLAIVNSMFKGFSFGSESFDDTKNAMQPIVKEITKKTLSSYTKNPTTTQMETTLGNYTSVVGSYAKGIDHRTACEANARDVAVCKMYDNVLDKELQFNAVLYQDGAIANTYEGGSEDIDLVIKGVGTTDQIYIETCMKAVDQERCVAKSMYDSSEISYNRTL